MIKTAFRMMPAAALGVLALAGCAERSQPVGPDAEPALAHRGHSSPIMITDLGTLGGRWAVATDINNRGDVVGFSETASGDTRAFLWTRKDGMRDLGTLGGAASAAHAINESGQVVGGAEDASGGGAQHAFIWSEQQGMRPLPQLVVDGVDEFWSIAFDINDRGDAVGYTAWDLPVRWPRSGGAEWLDGGGRTGAAWGINNQGTIVADISTIAGGFVENREYTGAVCLPGTPCVALMTSTDIAASATAINNAGQITGHGERIRSFDEDGGFFELVGPFQAFRWDRNHVQYLGTLGGSWGGWGEDVGIGNAINERGDVAGMAFNTENDRRAFLWSPRAGMQDLGTLGGAESAAMGLNNRGEVVGWSHDEMGNQRAVLWSHGGRPVALRGPHAGRSRFRPSSSDCPPRLEMLVELGALRSCPRREKAAPR